MNFILINILVLFKIIINEDNNISECKLNSNSGSSYNQCKNIQHQKETYVVMFQEL